MVYGLDVFLYIKSVMELQNDLFLFLRNITHGEFECRSFKQVKLEKLRLIALSIVS